MNTTRAIACVLGCQTVDGHPYPADAGYMTCTPCSERLWSTLRTIASDYAELVGDPAHLLPAAGEPGPRRPGYGSAAPLNLHVIALTDARSDQDGGPALSAPAVLGSWVRMVAEETRATWSVTTVAAMVDWLLNRWTWITQQPWVDDFAQEARELAAALDRQLRPRHVDLVYIGPCGARLDDATTCMQGLYGAASWKSVRCPACAADWDMETRRYQLRSQLSGYLMTATEMSGALRAWIGLHVSASKIRGYAFRGRLAQYPAHQWDRRKAPRYCVGDVLRVMESSEEQAG